MRQVSAFAATEEEEETVMVNGAQLSNALRGAAVSDPRRPRIVTGAAERSGWPISGTLVVFHLGCLLTAMLFVVALSWFAAAPVRGATAIEQATGAEPLVPTIDEIGGGHACLTFGSVYSR